MAKTTTESNEAPPRGKRPPSSRRPAGVAGIQYMGLPGITEGSKQAIVRLIQCNDVISSAKILSVPAGGPCRSHALLLTLESDGFVAIKSGFSSGYLGEGPSGFKFVIQLLERHGVKIQECDVSADIFERLDSSSLTEIDLISIGKSQVCHPSRLFDYGAYDEYGRGDLWDHFPPVLPYHLVHPKIRDLALRFFKDPESNIMKGYKRLEDILRKRIKSQLSGAKLFQEAFLSDSAKLTWKGLNRGEVSGRGQLFVAVYLAFRNPRAHLEYQEGNFAKPLREFLILNELYYFEEAAVRARYRKKRAESAFKNPAASK